MSPARLGDNWQKKFNCRQHVSATIGRKNTIIASTSRRQLPEKTQLSPACLGDNCQKKLNCRQHGSATIARKNSIVASTSRRQLAERVQWSPARLVDNSQNQFNSCQFFPGLRFPSPRILGLRFLAWDPCQTRRGFNPSLPPQWPRAFRRADTF